MPGLQAPRRVGTLNGPADERPLARALALSPTPTVVAGLLTAAGIVLDQATKLVAVELLTGRGSVDLLGPSIGWDLVYNPGAAFGLPAPPWLFLVVTVLVSVIVVRSVPRTSDRLQASAYGLLLAGALGNLVDRVLRAEDGPLTGRVVDFVAWGSFPRFNLADSWITIGFVLLVVTLWREERRHAAQERADAATTGQDAEAAAVETAEIDTDGVART